MTGLNNQVSAINNQVSAFNNQDSNRTNRTGKLSARTIKAEGQAFKININKKEFSHFINLNNQNSNEFEYIRLIGYLAY